MFAWSRTEVVFAVVLAGLVCIGGVAHLWLTAKHSSRTIVVEAGGASRTAAVNGKEAVGSSESDGSSAPPRPAAMTVRAAAQPADELPAPSGGQNVEPAGGSEGNATDVMCTCETESGEPPDFGHTKVAPEPDDGPGTGFVDLIDINTALPSELQRLPGIGPALAERIVAYREAWGPFSTIEDIMEVSGIGPATFARMQHLLKVD